MAIRARSIRRHGPTQAFFSESIREICPLMRLLQRTPFVLRAMAAR